MTNDEYVNALVLLWAAAEAVSSIDLPAMRNRIGRAETLGPILDPTLYREKALQMDQDKQLVDAFIPVRALMLKLKEKS